MFGIHKTKVVTDTDRINEFLTRGVERIYPSNDFLKARLQSGQRLSMYLGVDPTGPTLHIGHLIPLLKLAQFQKLGHQVILLIGDNTAMIGDPTDKLATRVPLSHVQVLENARLYKKQASQILSFDGDNPAILKYNSEWLSKMNLEKMLNVMSYITYAQTIKRGMFQERIDQGKDLSLHEFMYPIMQGYDSVAMEVDGEVGGNDQTFNMLVGRDLLKKMKNKEKFVIAMKLLVDPSGKKMGKSEGNMVSFDQSPEEMFGKVMSWGDGLIVSGFEIVTNIPVSEIESIKSDLEKGSNPKDSKVRLAKEIIKMIHGSEAAERAQENFENTFKKGEISEDAKVASVEMGTQLADVLLQEKLVSSKTDFKRLILSNAISEIESEVTITNLSFTIQKNINLRIGKKRFIKIKLK